MISRSYSSSLLLSCLATAATTPPNVPPALSNILANTHQSPLYTYPTDLTRDIPTVKIHSHNDYWRDVPFYSALSVGAISIEADVWLYNETLYVREGCVSPVYSCGDRTVAVLIESLARKVGHERSALTAERTFEALYINPILDTLQRENPQTPFVTASTKNGVFDTDSAQTLYLWIDIKTDGEEAFPYVSKALEPLRSAGYLTTVNSSSTSPLSKSAMSPITAIGTGNTPLSSVLALSPTRDIFYDAPLPDLASSAPSASSSNITSSSSGPVALIASTNFAAQFGTAPTSSLLNDTQLTTLRDQIQGAHEKGIGVRYWDTPPWPTSTRNGLWRLLVDEGVDLVNVDDLIAGAGLGERGEHW